MGRAGYWFAIGVGVVTAAAPVAFGDTIPAWLSQGAFWLGVAIIVISGALMVRKLIIEGNIFTPSGEKPSTFAKIDGDIGSLDVSNNETGADNFADVKGKVGAAKIRGNKHRPPADKKP